MLYIYISAFKISFDYFLDTPANLRRNLIEEKEEKKGEMQEDEEEQEEEEKEDGNRGIIQPNQRQFVVARRD